MRDRAREKDEIKQGLKDRIEDLCSRLLPDGRRQGRFWVSNNPVTRDHGQSPELKVALDRDHGAWICWRSTEKGDVIGLVAYCLETDFRGAMDFSRDFLGLRSMSRQERADFSRVNEARRVSAEQEARQKALDRRQAVVRRFEQADIIDLAAPSAAAAVVIRYFGEGRGTPLSEIAHRDLDTMRAVASIEWWEGAVFETRNGCRQKVKAGPKFPAVISAFRSPTGILTGLHHTFLDPYRPAKAPVPDPKKAKLMYGDAKGSVIRISHGPEGVPPEMATRPGPLVLCEGCEDGTSLAIGLPEARVWAGGSLAGMAGAPVWLDCISSVFVAGDNDWKSAAARAQFDKVLETIEAHGKPVEVMRSAIGKDFNDGMTE